MRKRARSTSSENAPSRSVERIEISGFEMETWFYSPFPEPYGSKSKLFFCDYCLRYFCYVNAFVQHKSTCEMRFPPGDEIYRRGSISLFRVYGKKHKTYSQSLCLLAKSFLDHKTLCFDVDPFEFVVLVEKGKLRGYYSREIDHQSLILACIAVLPPFQGKGYGGLLVDASYALAARKNQIGSPERPLSKSGEIVYLTYWTKTLLKCACALKKKTTSVSFLVEKTRIAPGDVVFTFKKLGMIRGLSGGRHEIVVDLKIAKKFLDARSDVWKLDSEKLVGC